MLRRKHKEPEEFHVEDPPDPAVEQMRKMFDQVRETYQAAGGRSGRRFDQVLARAVLIWRDSGESLEEFVTRRVRLAAQYGVPLFPTVLTGGRLAELSELDREDATTRDLYAYKAQLAILTERARLYGHVAALRDPANPFTPLFRHAFARLYGLDQLADQYSEQAMFELRANPAARRLFQDILGV
jgi:hypothetical protein